MHVLSEVDTVRLANIIVNEVGIIDDDSKERILQALDVFIRSKVGDFNRVSKLLDDTLLAYKELLQQQQELCATIKTLRTHTKQLLSQNSVITNKLSELENDIRSIDSKFNEVLVSDNHYKSENHLEDIEEYESNDVLIAEVDKTYTESEDLDSKSTEKEQEDTTEEEPPKFVKDLVFRLEEEERRECQSCSSDTCSRMDKDEADKKMSTVPDSLEIKVTGNIKDITDPILEQLTFLELIDVCKYLKIEIPKRCKYNQLLKLISKHISSEEEILEVVSNATGREVKFTGNQS